MPASGTIQPVAVTVPVSIIKVSVAMPAIIMPLIDTWCAPRGRRPVRQVQAAHDSAATST